VLKEVHATPDRYDALDKNISAVGIRDIPSLLGEDE
jgi:hypothetical protein